MFCNTKTRNNIPGPAGRNPCFSGQCFAILDNEARIDEYDVAILVLVDSVLQYSKINLGSHYRRVAILVLVDSVLQ